MLPRSGPPGGPGRRAKKTKWQKELRFTYKSNSGVLTEITFASNPNPNKYEIVTNIGQNIRTLTIKTLDKYDSGSDTYYTNVDGETYCTYDILIFSKNKSF